MQTKHFLIDAEHFFNTHETFLKHTEHFLKKARKKTEEKNIQQPVFPKKGKQKTKIRSSVLARWGRPICAPFRFRLCFLMSSMGVDQEVSFISA